MKAIITFHSIDDRETVLSFPTAMFADMITGLLDKGVSICTLDQLILPETDNAVSITFDDGMQSVYKNALPVLADAKVPSHIYLTTGYVGGQNKWPTQPESAPVFEMMGWHEIEACVKGGMYIENHTVSHPDLRMLGRSKIEDECERADSCIAEHFGSRPRHFAYPYGTYNSNVSTIVSGRYKTCVTTKLLPLGREIVAAELPRLDSYYLQNRWLYNHLFSPVSSSYLFGRHILRVIRRAF
jgi:peptidoglycan/xylan/chitin deacetylase (PgdA/CDA1 family)